MIAKADCLCDSGGGTVYWVNVISDRELLTNFAGSGSQEAFRALVERHIHSVYRAALRRTDGQAQLAEDVVQQVFTQLARNARKAVRFSVLEAWLHAATRNAAINAMKSETSRRARELEAHRSELDNRPEHSVDWSRLRPVMDGAIDDLSDADRSAVVLRFLESRSYTQVAAALGLTENAARMRTERALEKVRTSLAKRGITSTAAALGALLEGQSAGLAPAGLAGAVSGRAINAAAGAANAAGLTLPLKMAIAAAVVGLGVAGAWRLIERSGTGEMLEAPQKAVSATASTPPTSAEDQGSPQSNRLTPAEPSPSLITRGPVSEEEKRAVAQNLFRISAAADQYRSNYDLTRDDLLIAEDLVGPGKMVNRVRPVNGEDYLQVLISAHQVSLRLRDGTIVSYPETPPPPPRPVTLAENGVVTYAIVRNLEKLATAVDAFVLENKRYPSSLGEIVGPGRKLPELTTIIGEEYTTVDLSAEVYSVSIPGGVISHRRLVE